jgi:hypothetical protein
MSTVDLIRHVSGNFGGVFIAGIPSLLNDDGAFLSFICSLTAIEALGGFLRPKGSNSERFREFIKGYFADPYPAQADSLWKLRNAAVHGFSPGPYKLTHHNSYLHLTSDGGQTILNAEDFYAALVTASKRYFDAVTKDAALQAAFVERTKDPATGIMVVAPVAGKP